MTDLKYILRRVVVALLIIGILAAVRKATAQQVDFHTDNYGFDNLTKFGYFTATLSNPGSSSVTVAQSQSFPATGQMTVSGYGNGAHQVRVWSSSFSSITIPAGGTVIRSFNLSGGNDVGQLVNTWSNVQTFTGTVRLEVNGVAVQKAITAFPFRIKAVGTTVSDYVSPAGPYDLGTIYLSSPAPLAKITVNADGAAAGTRQFQIGTASETDVTLIAGANVLLNSALPSAFADGALVTVKQSGTVIGSGNIVKDTFGNFDLAITATGIPTAGVLTVTWPSLFNGQAAVLKQTSQPDTNITLSGASYTANFLPASVVPQGTVFSVLVNAVVVGVGTVVYNPQGSWAVNIQLQGQTDLNPGINEALFVLDLAAYNGAPLVLVLVVDGVEYSVKNVVGDVNTGVRTVESYRLPNPTGALNGKQYAWKITGTDGTNIYQGVTIATGITPSVHQLDVGNVAASYSFRVDNSATINGNLPNPQAENTYDPTAPPVHDPGATPEEVAAETKRVESKRDEYEAVNKAINDALNNSTKANASLPGVGQGVEGGKLGATAVKTATTTVDGAISAAGQGAGKSVGGWSGTSALQISLAGLGTIELDPGNYGIAPGIIRAVALMALLWVYYKFCMSIFRNSMA